MEFVVLHLWSYVPAGFPCGAMLFYLLACCGLLLYYLVRLSVCCFIQILQINACKMIGGYEFFIYGVDSDLLFPAVVICTTIGGGCLHLDFIVPL